MNLSEQVSAWCHHSLYWHSPLNQSPWVQRKEKDSVNWFIRKELLSLEPHTSMLLLPFLRQKYMQKILRVVYLGVTWCSRSKWHVFAIALFSHFYIKLCGRFPLIFIIQLVNMSWSGPAASQQVTRRGRTTSEGQPPAYQGNKYGGSSAEQSSLVQADQLII